MKRLALIALLALTGCMGKGVRALEEREQRYFAALETELSRSSAGITEVITGSRTTEELVRRDILSFENQIRDAKIVYSVREVLKSPRDDSTKQIQITRAKVLLYVLAEADAGDAAELARQLAATDADRRRVLANHDRLLASVGAVIATGRLLHNYLDREATEQVQDVIAETGRQIVAFDDQIQKGDATNPVVGEAQRLSAATRLEAAPIETDAHIAGDQVLRLADLWHRFNSER
jgi:hypothetical protein